MKLLPLVSALVALGATNVHAGNATLTHDRAAFEASLVGPFTVETFGDVVPERNAVVDEHRSVFVSGGDSQFQQYSGIESNDQCYVVATVPAAWQLYGVDQTSRSLMDIAISVYGVPSGDRCESSDDRGSDSDDHMDGRRVWRV